MGRRGSRKSRSSQSTPRDPGSANATPRQPGSANATPRDGPKGVKFGETSAAVGAVALDGPADAVFHQQMTVAGPDRQLSRSNTDGLEQEESLEAMYGDNLEATRDQEKFEAVREQQNAVIETREQPVVPMSKQDTIVEEDDEVYDMHSGRQDSGPQLMSMMTSASAYQRGATRDSVRSSIADDGDTLDAMFDDALDAAAATKDQGMDRFKRMSVIAKGRLEQRPPPPVEQARASDAEPSPEEAHPPPASRDPEDSHPEEEKPKGLELPFDTPHRGGEDQGGGWGVCCGGRSKPGDPQQDECTIL